MTTALNRTTPPLLRRASAVPLRRAHAAPSARSHAILYARYLPPRTRPIAQLTHLLPTSHPKVFLPNMVHTIGNSWPVRDDLQA